ncbi:hypothetical protein [Kribbella sp. NBC_00359]|uniref:hypothetical protein n=1 Tax=Kribbella sp. NBC_00359 TaxID=2975966 RepID=UPI002E1BA7B1
MLDGTQWSAASMVVGDAEDRSCLLRVRPFAALLGPSPGATRFSCLACITPAAW